MNILIALLAVQVLWRENMANAKSWPIWPLIGLPDVAGFPSVTDTLQPSRFLTPTQTLEARLLPAHILNKSIEGPASEAMLSLASRTWFWVNANDLSSLAQRSLLSVV